MFKDFCSMMEVFEKLASCIFLIFLILGLIKEGNDIIKIWDFC